MTQFCVLMSLYIKEKPENARACFESLLNQTVKADEWVIVEDGPLSLGMYDLLDEYQKKYPGLIKRIGYSENRGLGAALQVGLLACSYDLVARMDTDDIARNDRFEKQIREFDADPELDICGSQIEEFEDTPDVVVSKRIVPTTHQDIINYQKKRDAFNHMTVMFKKKAVLDAGNYQPCPLMEDTYLWARMICNGAKCKNIDEPLVCARIGKDLFERRGGWEYFKKYREGQKRVLSIGFISYKDYLEIILIQLIVSLMPGKIRGIIFKKILHR